MPEFPNQSQLKTHARHDQGPRGLHVMILKSDGSTRPFNISRAFLWIVGLLAALALGALALAAHLVAGLSNQNEFLSARLEDESRLNQLRDYARAVDVAPEEARRILELLDRAIVMSESGDDGAGLAGVPDTAPDDGAASVPAAAAGGAGENNDAEDGTAAPAAAGDSPGDSPAEAPGAPAAGDAGTGNGGAADEAPAGDAREQASLQAAWKAWSDRLPMPGETASLDIDDFEVSPGGQVTFLLRQSGESGRREKGRVNVILAVRDAGGAVSLVPAPPFDMEKPEEGWTIGVKYNIVASKLIRARGQVPPGSKIVNAEVVAWEEDSRELVYRKKILIEDN
ncbi:MAG: hypothetical protein LBP95_02520 [Deltaproteobacteria bacterium]|nr:hypothetical protein [Deltaproteobacteria bacterium]